MRVYRIEDANGRGPYYGRRRFTSLHGMFRSHGADYRTHPTPFTDLGRDPKDEEFCAFNSLSDLFDWFGEWTSLLAEKRFKIATYEIDEALVEEGFYQVLVPLAQGELIEKKTIKSVQKAYDVV